MPTPKTSRNTSSLSLPSVTLALRQEITKLCEEHDRNEDSKPDFRRCVVLRGYFIKYDCHRSLYPQYKTQQYIYEKALGDANAPRVPDVYHHFSPEHKMAYLVMEYIDAKATPVRNAPEKVAVALQWLLGLRCLNRSYGRWMGPP